LTCGAEEGWITLIGMNKGALLTLKKRRKIESKVKKEGRLTGLVIARVETAF